MVAPADLMQLAAEVAKKNGLMPGVVQALCQVESSWNVRAARLEPKFLMRYLFFKGAAEMPGHVPSDRLLIKEKIQRSYSYGLTQVMGELCREYGFYGEFESLFDPSINLYYGCLKLKRCLDKTGDYRQALLCYNGGGDRTYPARVFKVLDQLTATR